jgi:DNA polymerase-3 subunit gamma/tau
MSYLVLARRFRPQTFDDIVGQEHVTRTIKNAILADRVAHAFLFAGARGVGKTTAARVLAKALNCVEGPTGNPCGVCEQCQGVADSRAVDVQEIDGASNNSVDDIRALRETVPYRPASGRFKIYIVDEVHMLTTSAFNALLKTLEEPPAHVKFIFATTEPHKIPVTILSRCQRYDFRLIPSTQIQAKLREITTSEKVEAEPAALSLLAREAEGSMRDALSLLDQVLAFNAQELRASEVARILGVADRQLLLQISGALLGGDAAGALRAVESATTVGCDLTRFSHDLLRHLRNLVVSRQCPKDRDLIDLSDVEIEELTAQIEGHDVAELHRLFLLFAKSSEEIARSSQPRLLLEMTLARLASLEPMISLADLSRRLERLGRSTPGPGATGAPFGGPPPAGGAPPPRGPSPRSSAPRRGAEPDQASPRRAPERAAPARAPAPKPLPVEAATPSSRPSAGAEHSGDAKERWKQLLGHIQKTSAPLYHIFRHAKPLEVTAAKLRLELPDEPFYQGEAENPARRESLAEACQSILGAKPEVKLEIERSSGQSSLERAHIEQAAKTQDRRRAVQDHAMVRATLREFEGAKIEEIKLYTNKE